ncbi:MAG: diguanylate cyclase [Christensenellales bacterium]
MNIALIVVDILGWVFNGLPGTLNRVCNTGFNLLLYIVVPAAPSLWVLYTNYQIYQDNNRMKTPKRILITFFVLNALISIANIFFGWYFRVDAQNIYHRGDYFWVYPVYNLSLIVYTFIFILINRRLIEKKLFFSLLLYYPPQIIGILIQTFSYGVSYNWTGMMLSLLIIYFNIQNRGLNTDYLTGAYSRRQLDQYAKARVRNITDGNPFSAIMFDLDGLKQINDHFGHDIGDEALKDCCECDQK